MIPLRDMNPTHSVPVVTYGLIAINVLVFVYTLQFTSEQELFRFFQEYSVVPRFLLDNPFSLEAGLDVLRSMFFHGGWLHIGSNMLYLWIFGDNVEDRKGKIAFLLLYLLWGAVAALAQVFISPNSSVPLVGASGAIAGVLGYYLVAFPAVRVHTLFIFGIFVRVIPVSALLLLGFWFALQLFQTVASLGPAAVGDTGGVAFMAHAAGFVAGALTALVTGVRNTPVQEQGPISFR